MILHVGGVRINLRANIYSVITLLVLFIIFVWVLRIRHGKHILWKCHMHLTL